MTKKINLSEAIKAAQVARQAAENAEFYLRMCTECPRFYSLEDRKTIEAVNASKEAEKAKAAALAPIDEIIRQAEGKARERRITAAEIVDCLVGITDDLNITKTALNGTRVSADLNAEDLPKAYKYTAKSTHFSALFDGGKWWLVGVGRGDLRRASKRLALTLSDTAKAAIIDRIEKGII